MKSKCISIRKFEQSCINEDAVLAKEKRIAISDGAGYPNRKCGKV